MNKSETQLTPRVDDVIFNIEDYIGGNIEGVERVDRMGLTVFLRRQLEDFRTQALTSLKTEMEKKNQKVSRGAGSADTSYVLGYNQAISECQGLLDTLPSSRQDKRSDNVNNGKGK